ncbi:hypothetical protein Ciccas_007516 [Cichlidogyrus casuarinus]|uniref:Uncharacterized protein n=1 Tax=Cichlidogyrus casuarinus TaxID=1844966 RepID=A0ABD2Q2M9_9PLAT
MVVSKCFNIKKTKKFLASKKRSKKLSSVPGIGKLIASQLENEQVHDSQMLFHKFEKLNLPAYLQWYMKSTSANSWHTGLTITALHMKYSPSNNGINLTPLKTMEKPEKKKVKVAIPQAQGMCCSIQ